MKSILSALAMLALFTASPGGAREPEPVRNQTLQERVERVLGETGPGTRFGLVVANETEELIAIAPDQRFIPASNTKLFTTAAAFANRVNMDRPDVAGGTAVRIEQGDAILTGYGDARMSSADDCVTNCLATLADAVAARTRSVRHVVGDASLFPDERWSAGMSWNNIPTRSGTAISALSLDDNELRLTVTPGATGAPGAPPKVEGSEYFRIDNRASTVATGATDLGFDRLPGERAIRLTGTIAAGGAQVPIRLGIDDPAHYAAWRFAEMLRARGVRVTGDIVSRYRRIGPSDDPHRRGAVQAVRVPVVEPLARLVPPPLIDDVAQINKVSQNLHAELLLRRVGLIEGTGSVADGLLAVRMMMREAGVADHAYAFSDGSGMSPYNRLAPRGGVAFLRWASSQSWGSIWAGTLPVSGVDGTLSNRFRGTPLEERISAKTGSLNATHALTGFLVAESGEMLYFSMFANDVPEGVAAREAMDRALLLIASEL